MKKVTIVEAIQQVMRLDGKPMTVPEVYDAITRLDLYDFKAKDPIHIVGTQIRRHLVGKTANSYSRRKIFEARENHRFHLAASPLRETELPKVDDSRPVSVSRREEPSLKRENNKDHPDGAGAAKRTIILAIKDVMERQGKPMTVQQVYEAIVDRNLYDFKANQPAHVVRSQIRRHCLGLDFPTASDLKHFGIQGKSKYYALPYPIREKSSLSQIGALDTGPLVRKPSRYRSRPIRRDQVFISYSHKDSKWLQRLQVHLRPLERAGTINRWDDTRIQPGSKWRNEIEKAIKRARVAVLLISADFLASEFVINNEVPPLLQAAAVEGAMILPVIVSPCRFEKTEGLRQFQAVNGPSRPLSALDKTKREEIFVKVADAVEAALYPL
ncbi:MAG: hypothetical protein QOH71_1488 [Blastocatellia bacterium]|jgi:hypothetical protein|nr:hypothetical protein [Blastocatellia bacterium]